MKSVRMITKEGMLLKSSAGKRDGSSSGLRRSRKGSIASIGNMLNKWERRRFVLASDGTLCWYKEGSSEARNEAACTSAMIIILDDGSSSFDLEMAPPQARTLSLRADDEDERSSWVHALLAVGAVYHPQFQVRLPEAASSRARQATGKIERSAVIPWRDIEMLDGQPLGEGAMGVVQRARYRGKDVAVKLVRVRHVTDEDDATEDDGPAGLQRNWHDKLLEECELMLRLNNPYVLRVFGLASDGLKSSQGIVMEQLEQSLSALLADDAERRTRQLHWRRGDGSERGEALLRIASEVAEALDYLHGFEGGILHRDLKPGNILLSPPPEREAKVTDFGEAKATSRRQSGLIRGTPAFIAPEVARREAYGSPADVWSYGCLLVAMARRAPNGPYAAELRSQPASAVIERVGAGGLHPMSDAASKSEPSSADWPASVADLAAACVAREAADRPEFGEIAREIRFCEPAPPRAEAAGEAAGEAEAEAAFVQKEAALAAARAALESFRMEQAQPAAPPVAAVVLS